MWVWKLKLRSNYSFVSIGRDRGSCVPDQPVRGTNTQETLSLAVPIMLYTYKKVRWRHYILQLLILIPRIVCLRKILSLYFTITSKAAMSKLIVKICRELYVATRFNCSTSAMRFGYHTIFKSLIIFKS